MGKSQESFNKKEVRKKKEKKRKEKEKKRIEKKEEGESKNSFDDMIAYVDNEGNITSTPPDPEEKEEVNAEDIEVSVSKKDDIEDDPIRKGVVSFFNDDKGFGFIRDMETNESVFVHANNLEEPIKENNMVNYEVQQGPKGLAAYNVKLYKKENEE